MAWRGLYQGNYKTHAPDCHMHSNHDSPRMVPGPTHYLVCHSILVCCSNYELSQDGTGTSTHSTLCVIVSQYAVVTMVVYSADEYIADTRISGYTNNSG